MARYSKSIDNITPKMLAMTVIHIKDDTKELLMKFMAEIRQKEKKRVSFDETIKYLLVRGKGKNKKSLLPLFGCIGKEQAEQAYKDIEELKLLDEKRFEHLSRSRS
jgi:formate dehydrogenase maturation protein FdhE